MKSNSEDRYGNSIIRSGWHCDYHVEDFSEYPQIYSEVSESYNSESVYVYYRNNENGNTIKVRFSLHACNAVEFGDVLDSSASRDEILFHLGLRKRTFVPSTYLMIWTQQIKKKLLGNYEQAPLTIKEMYDLGEGADLSEYVGKLAKDSNYLILGNTVEKHVKKSVDRLGNEYQRGKYIYEAL